MRLSAPSYVVCPQCVGRGEPALRNGRYVCPNCGAVVPTRYVEERLEQKLIAPVGFSGHGKTLYLTVLMGSLIDRRTYNLDSSFLLEPLNQEAFDVVVKGWERLKAGMLPEPTGMAFQSPSLARVFGLGKDVARYVTFFDVQGGTFERWDPTQLDPRILTFFAEADVLLVMFSPAEKTGVRNLQMLMQAYVNHTVSQPGGVASLKRKRVVLVHTKGDELLPFLQNLGYADVANYLLADPDPADAGYMTVLRYISDRLADFTARAIPGGAGFHAMCRRNFGSLEYCVVSALGSAPDANNHLPSGVTPRRVLDPLLLAAGS